MKPHRSPDRERPQLLPRASDRAVGALLLGVLLFSSGCTFFKYGTCQPFGGGQSKIVPVSMYDPRAANRTNRLAAWAYYDANYRASHLITDPQGNPMVLSETPPDAATSIQRVLALSAKYKGLDAAISKYINSTITKLGERTSTVELLRDGGYNIRELAFNNRLQGPVTNLVTTTAANGITNTTTTCTTIQSAADQRLQQLFSVIQTVETSRLVEQAERAKSVSLYLECCRNSKSPVDTNVIAQIQRGEPISIPTQTNETNQPIKPELNPSPAVAMISISPVVVSIFGTEAP